MKNKKLGVNHLNLVKLSSENYLWLDKVNPYSGAHYVLSAASVMDHLLDNGNISIFLNSIQYDHWNSMDYREYRRLYVNISNQYNIDIWKLTDNFPDEVW